MNTVVPVPTPVEAADETPVERPLICVVVPSFNAGAYLSEALRSLAAQTYRQWECIVVDDGSSDDTAAIARRHAAADHRFRLISQANGGSSRARNAGVAVASDAVEYVAFLDADDIWLPDSLAVLLANLAGSADAVGAYGLAEYMDGAGHPVLQGLHPMRQRDRRRMGRLDLEGLGSDQPYTFASLVISGTLWPSSVVLHRRDVFERVNGFDPQLRQLQDWDLYLRMSRRGPFLPVDRQVAWYRQHDANITKRSERVAYYTMFVRWKTWRSPDNTPAQRRESRRVWRRLSARWLIRTAIAECYAWRRADAGTAWSGLKAWWMFTSGLVRGHPARPDERTARLVQTFVTGADHEGRRDRRALDEKPMRR